MKIASYNVMSGGFNTYTYEQTRPQRLDLIIEAVRKLNADFVSLIDTFRWDEIYTVNKLQSMFNYPYVYCINLEDERLKKLGHNNGLTVLTRNKVQSFETLKLFNRNSIKTAISLNDRKVDLFTIYLDDKSEDTRVRQVHSLLQKTNVRNPTIIMGDLNTFSPKDIPVVVSAIRSFLDSNPSLEAKFAPVLNEMQKAQVSKILEAAEFIDTNLTSQTTAPTSLLGVKNLADIFRLDYIFCSKNIKWKNFKVHKYNFFDKVSDHFPITLEIL